MERFVKIISKALSKDSEKTQGKKSGTSTAANTAKRIDARTIMQSSSGCPFPTKNHLIESMDITISVPPNWKKLGKKDS